MRAIFTVLVIASIVSACITISIAQTSLSNDSSNCQHDNVISTDPLFTAAGYINGSYERAISRKFSLHFSAYYSFKNLDEALFSSTNFFFTHAQLRFYPFGKAPKGFFVAPYLLYGICFYQTRPFYDYGYTFPSQPGSVSSISPGVAAGYKFIIEKRIALEIFYGAGPNFHWGDNNGYANSLPIAEKWIVTGIAGIGYSFR